MRPYDQIPFQWSVHVLRKAGAVAEHFEFLAMDTNDPRRSSSLRYALSASTRKRMSLAQRARWAKAKNRAPKPKRTISAAGRKRIAAAQRARWAKLKAQQKKAAA
jgi:hypothetical protein